MVDPVYVLGSRRFNTGSQKIALFWGIFLLLLSSLLIGPTFWSWWQAGFAQVEVNGELITLGSEHAKATIGIIAFMLLWPTIGFIALTYGIRLRKTPRIVVWLTDEGLYLHVGGELHTFDWSTFDKEHFDFQLGGIAILPLRDQKGTIEIGKVSSPNIFFQLLDRYISGSTDLVRFHRLEKKIKKTSNGHTLRRFYSACLYLLKPITIGLGILLFGSIPYIFLMVVHLKDDGDLIFRFFEYGAIALVFVSTLATLWNSIKSIMIEIKSPGPSQLWHVLSFRQNVAFLIYAFSFLLYFYWLEEQTVEEAFFFENLFYFFYAIPLFFLGLILMALCATGIQKYLLPVLALREFGKKGIAGNWSPALAPEEGQLRTHDDTFLHQVSGLFSIKPVYAYYDRRLDPEGFQDDSTEFFLQSKRWLDYVTACASIAQGIIIVPASSESLLMEMNMLREKRLLHKTFVLMPPENRDNQEVRKQWDIIQSAIREKGYHLPDYEAGGMVYLPEEDYSIKKSYKLHHNIRNLFFIPQLRRWQLSRQSVHDQIYTLADKLEKTLQ